MKTTYALLVAGLASQQVAATWNFFDNFGTPNYSDNKCSDKQQGGFDWSDLNDGDSLGNYGDFDFSGGWKCSNSFGKRDSLTKRTFNSKCIKNTVSKQKPASFGCSKRGFSISHMDISAEFDAEIELHYTMGDGSICKQRGSCSAGGSTLKNTQCGGAKSVQVYLGSHYKGDKESCEIGFHNIGFDCSPETPYTPPTPPKVPSTTSMAQYPTSPVETPSAPAKECGQYGGKDCSSKPVQTPTGGYATSTPEASSSPVKTPTGGACQGGNCYPTSTPEASTSPVKTPTSSAPQIPVSSQAPFTNTTFSIFSSIVESTTVTPQTGTSSAVAPPVKSSAAPGCGYGQSCYQSSAIVSSGTPLPATSSLAPQPSPSLPPVDVTDSVPKCMNSWLQISAPGCKDNTDSECYCVKPEFTKNVIDCLTARCGNDDETRKALQYFIGICAEHISKNPQIVGDCPSYIPLNPTPAAPTGGASAPLPATSAPASAPPSITSAAPAAPAEQTPCTTITYGTTTLTVPQVHFTTSPNAPGATPAQPVALVPGTAPAQTPAATTPVGGAGAPYPTATTMGTATVPLGSGTGAIRPSSPPQFTGAASPLNIVPKGAMFGAVLALFAL